MGVLPKWPAWAWGILAAKAGCGVAGCGFFFILWRTFGGKKWGLFGFCHTTWDSLSSLRYRRLLCRRSQDFHCPMVFQPTCWRPKDATNKSKSISGMVVRWCFFWGPQLFHNYVQGTTFQADIFRLAILWGGFPIHISSVRWFSQGYKLARRPIWMFPKMGVPQMLDGLSGKILLKWMI